MDAGPVPQTADSPSILKQRQLLFLDPWSFIDLATRDNPPNLENKAFSYFNMMW